MQILQFVNFQAQKSKQQDYYTFEISKTKQESSNKTMEGAAPTEVTPLQSSLYR